MAQLSSPVVYNQVPDGCEMIKNNSNSNEFENTEEWIDDDTLLDSRLWCSADSGISLGLPDINSNDTPTDRCAAEQLLLLKAYRSFLNSNSQPEKSQMDANGNYVSDSTESVDSGMDPSETHIFNAEETENMKIDSAVEVDESFLEFMDNGDINFGRRRTDTDESIDMDSIESMSMSDGELDDISLAYEAQPWANDVPVEVPAPIVLRRTYFVSQDALKRLQKSHGTNFIMMKERWTEHGIGSGHWESSIRNSGYDALNLDSEGNFGGLQSSPAVHYVRLVYVINGLSLEILLSDYGYAECAMEAYCMDTQRTSSVLERMEQCAAELGFQSLHTFEPLQFL